MGRCLQPQGDYSFSVLNIGSHVPAPVPASVVEATALARENRAAVVVRTYFFCGASSLRRQWPQKLVFLSRRGAAGEGVSARARGLSSRPVAAVVETFRRAPDCLIMALCSRWGPSSYAEALFLMGLGIKQNAGLYALCTTAGQFNVALVTPRGMNEHADAAEMAKWCRTGADQNVSASEKELPVPENLLWWALMWKRRDTPGDAAK